MAAHGHIGLGWLDLAVVVAYVALMFGIGAWYRLRTVTRENYFLGGRRFGPLIQSFAYFGQAAAADGPVGVATTTFHNGAAGIWSSLLMIFSLPFFWIAVPWLRRLRIMTMGDFYVERYGSKRLGAAYALIASFGTMSLLSVGYIAVAKTVTAILADQNGAPAPISATAVIWTVFAITLGNSLLGGLTAAFYSSLLQSCSIVVLSVILIPFGLSHLSQAGGTHGFLGGFRALHARLPLNFFQVFGSASLPDFTWYYVLAISLVAGLTVMTMPNQLVANAAARDEGTARMGMLTGSLIKRLCTILWAICGLIAVALYGGRVADSDQVWGFATRELLGPVGCGLIGFMLIGLLSALLAVSNLQMLTISGLVVNNLYRPWISARSEAHYVAVARVSGAVFLSGAALLATQFDTLFQALKFSWEFFAIFGAAFWLGLKWRRANCKGAWASILFSAGMLYALPATLPVVLPGLRSDPRLMLQTQARQPASSGAGGTSIFWSQGLRHDAGESPRGCGYLYLDLIMLRAAGWPLENNPAPLNETLRIAVRLLLPFLILALVSQMSRSEDPELIDRFFSKMRRPILASAPTPPTSSSESELSSNARPLQLLFPGSNWEFYKWSRADGWGALLAAALVLAVLGILVTAMSLGS